MDDEIDEICYKFRNLKVSFCEWSRFNLIAPQNLSQRRAAGRQDDDESQNGI